MNWWAGLFGLTRQNRTTSSQTPAGADSAKRAEALFAAGRTAFDAGDYAGALRYFEAALEIRHDHAHVHYYLGLVHLNWEHYEDAADCFIMATHFMPDLAPAVYNLGLDAYRKRDYAKAVEYFERAIELKPDFAQAHNNLGYTLFSQLEDYERGARHIENALRLTPGDPDALCNYSAVLIHRGELGKTLELCDRLLAKHPELHEVRLNRALAALKLGRFAQGWADYDARKLAGGNYVVRDFGFAEWQGEPLAGKTVLVYAEQGLGDQLMFASCLPDLSRQAGRCIVECAPQLEQLFRRSFSGATVRASDGGAQWLQGLGPIDYQTAIGSLPARFRTDISSFPRHAGYLKADDARVARWRKRLRTLGDARKIGISWRGGAPSTRRSLRSIALEDWLPLLERADCRFVSLQYGGAGAELAAMERDYGVRILNPQDAVDGYEETAALVCALDMVVSVQTALVHLCGALGRPVWALVPAVAEWRYSQEGEAMPWYPSVRVLRREPASTWRALIERVASDLVQTNNSPC